MDNLKALLKRAKNLEIVGFTTVWNYHRADHLDNLAKKKGTNINKAVEKIKEDGYKGPLTIYVARIGRSAHSTSTVAILKGLTSLDEIGSDYYSKRLGEVFIK